MIIGNNFFDFKNIDKKIYKIMKNGIKFSFVFCLVASFILVMNLECFSPSTYNIGCSLFQSGLFFLSMFIMCGFVFNSILKE